MTKFYTWNDATTASAAPTSDGPTVLVIMALHTVVPTEPMIAIIPAIIRLRV